MELLEEVLPVVLAFRLWLFGHMSNIINKLNSARLAFIHQVGYFPPEFPSAFGKEEDFMKQTLEAVYENGVFKPLRPPEIANGQQVRLMIEPLSQPSVDDLLELAAQVYQGLSEKDMDEIESIAINRRDFFGKKDP